MQKHTTLQICEGASRQITSHLNEIRNWMTGILLATLLLAASPAIAGTLGLGVALPEHPIQAPNFTLPTLAGGSETLSALRGRVVLLHFWASWCPPCRSELPNLVATAAQYQKKGLTLLAVDADKTDANGATNFVTKNKISLPIAFDKNNKVHHLYGVRVLPTTYIINRKGAIVGRIIGTRDWSSSAAQQLLSHLLGS